MNKVSCSFFLVFSLKNSRFLTFRLLRPFPSFSSPFRRRSVVRAVPAGAAICNITAASVAVTLFRFIVFQHLFSHDYQSSNHFILPAWFPSIRRLRIFPWAPPVIIPSIIFYMVSYYLDIDRSMLFLSLRSLLTPCWAHCFPKPPSFPCFVFHSIFQNTRLVV